MSPISRRSALRAGSATLFVGLSGCSFSQTDNSMIALELLNTDTSPHTVGIEFLRVDGGDEMSTRYEGEIDVDMKDAEGAGLAVREELLPSGPYLVRANIEGEPISDHYHLYPRCDGRAEYLRVSILTEEDASGFEFYHSCS
ncbi:hypothetical protein [Natronomonas amylolytica]|uniref:hypothetical protein n=1 Tax=Natronomonas amylolytica TaxID=3108498 RepID=UPI0030082BD0